jgi:hypothetical protein
VFRLFGCFVGSGTALDTREDANFATLALAEGIPSLLYAIQPSAHVLGHGSKAFIADEVRGSGGTCCRRRGP